MFSNELYLVVMFIGPILVIFIFYWRILGVMRARTRNINKLKMMKRKAHTLLNTCSKISDMCYFVELVP